jgi:hypothetical protein
MEKSLNLISNKQWNPDDYMLTAVWFLLTAVWFLQLNTESLICYFDAIFTANFSLQVTRCHTTAVACGIT